jgi:hypothetical protein
VEAFSSVSLAEHKRDTIERLAEAAEFTSICPFRSLRSRSAYQRSFSRCAQPAEQKCDFLEQRGIK